MTHIDDVFDRHERIALQLSGGRDSLAVLYLLRPYWPKITVYWCNSGAPFPETLETMGRVRAEVPNFIEIAGQQREVVDAFGLPSDIVPVSRTPLGRQIAGGSAPLLQDRYDCCARSMMNPTHQRMLDDGITLIIRGQRNSDSLKSPLRSGAVVDGFELLFPIEDWTSADVMDYLRAEQIPVPRFYTMLEHAPDCMTCSAYWEEGAAKYLKQHHPDAHAEVQRRLDTINAAVSEHIAAFNIEVNS
jgi:phosphoadenosine phosphosulfate reductase